MKSSKKRQKKQKVSDKELNRVTGGNKTKDDLSDLPDLPYLNELPAKKH